VRRKNQLLLRWNFPWAKQRTAEHRNAEFRRVVSFAQHTPRKPWRCRGSWVAIGSSYPLRSNWCFRPAAARYWSEGSNSPLLPTIRKGFRIQVFHPVCSRVPMAMEAGIAHNFLKFAKSRSDNRVQLHIAVFAG